MKPDCNFIINSNTVIASKHDLIYSPSAALQIIPGYYPMPHHWAKNEDRAQLCHVQIKGQINYLSLFSFIHTIEDFVLMSVYNQESK